MTRTVSPLAGQTIDPTVHFMTADWDGKIRTDCSSSCAMARLIGMRTAPAPTIASPGHQYWWACGLGRIRFSRTKPCGRPSGRTSS
jgi:hypothetical protein